MLILMKNDPEYQIIIIIMERKYLQNTTSGQISQQEREWRLAILGDVREEYSPGD